MPTIRSISINWPRWCISCSFPEGSYRNGFLIKAPHLGHRNPLRQESIVTVEPTGPFLPGTAEQFQCLILVPLHLFLSRHALHQRRKVEPGQRRPCFLSMNRVLKTVRQRNVREKLATEGYRESPENRIFLPGDPGQLRSYFCERCENSERIPLIRSNSIGFSLSQTIWLGFPSYPPSFGSVYTRLLAGAGFLEVLHFELVRESTNGPEAHVRQRNRSQRQAQTLNNNLQQMTAAILDRQRWPRCSVRS